MDQISNKYPRTPGLAVHNPYHYDTVLAECGTETSTCDGLQKVKKVHSAVYAKVTGSPYILSENGILYYVYGG